MAFRIKLKDSVESTIAVVKSKVAENGGTFNWNGSSGQLSLKTPLGKVEGNCKTISEQEIEINMTKLPLFVSENQVKGKIEEYLG